MPTYIGTPFFELLIGGPNQSHKVNFKELSLSGKGINQRFFLPRRQQLSEKTEKNFVGKRTPSLTASDYHFKNFAVVPNQREGRRCKRRRCLQELFSRFFHAYSRALAPSRSDRPARGLCPFLRMYPYFDYTRCHTPLEGAAGELPADRFPGPGLEPRRPAEIQSTSFPPFRHAAIFRRHPCSPACIVRRHSFPFPLSPTQQATPPPLFPT